MARPRLGDTQAGRAAAGLPRRVAPAASAAALFMRRFAHRLAASRGQFPPPSPSPEKGGSPEKGEKGGSDRPQLSRDSERQEGPRPCTGWGWQGRQGDPQSPPRERPFTPSGEPLSPQASPPNPPSALGSPGVGRAPPLLPGTLGLREVRFSPPQGAPLRGKLQSSKARNPGRAGQGPPLSPGQARPGPAVPGPLPACWHPAFPSLAASGPQVPRPLSCFAKREQIYEPRGGWTGGTPSQRRGHSLHPMGITGLEGAPLPMLPS